MPEMRYYEVSERRSVRVFANNPTDAVRIGSEAFNNGQDEFDHFNSTLDIEGNTVSRIKIESIDATEY